MRFLISSTVLAAVFFFSSNEMAHAQPTWQEEFAKMPLVENVTELNRSNCVRVMLNSFKANSAVQALVFMPGATDEFYFFRRARAQLTNTSPTLLDAVTALTNQTFVQATLNPPFLLLHSVEDPLEPIITVEDQHTADRIKRKHFERHIVFNDPDWDHVSPIIGLDLNTRITPRLGSHESYHFFRHSLAEYRLDGWDTLRAIALANKTKVIIKKNLLKFEGDSRTMALPRDLEHFQLKNLDASQLGR